MYLFFYYPIWFKKNNIQALINSSSKINTMILRYALKLEKKVRFINIKVQKINNFTVEMLKIVLASFQVENKLRKATFS